MPSVENVQVDGTYPAQGHYDERTGNPLRVHRNRVVKKMGRSIAEYRAPEGCARLPVGVIGFEKHQVSYTAERDQEQERLRYAEAPVVC